MRNDYRFRLFIWFNTISVIHLVTALFAIYTNFVFPLPSNYYIRSFCFLHYLRHFDIHFISHILVSYLTFRNKGYIFHEISGYCSSIIMEDCSCERGGRVLNTLQQPAGKWKHWWILWSCEEYYIWKGCTFWGQMEKL